MSLLKRYEQRRLRNIHAPHGPGSSRATVHEVSDVLKDVLYRGFDEKTQNANRTEFAHFVSETYGIPMQTAYGKLKLWSIKEWEAYGIIRLIGNYCSRKEINCPDWKEGEEWIPALKQWHETLSDKMQFYHYLRERGMCRTHFYKILKGESKLTSLQVVGLAAALNQWAQESLQKSLFK